MLDIEHAIVNNNLPTVANYLDSGGDANRVSEQTRESILGIAASKGAVGILQLLLEAGANPNSLNTTIWPLNAGASAGHRTIVEALLSVDADVDALDEDGSTALFSACARGDMEIASMLLEAGADARLKDNSGRKPIHIAAEKLHRQLVEALAPFSTPKDRKQAEFKVRLAEQGPLDDSSKQFLKAAEKGDLEIVTAYLERGGNVDVMNEDGWTATFFAAFRGKLDTLERLIEYGADMNHTDGVGSYPLVYASQMPDNPAYEYVRSLTNSKLCKEWDKRMKKAAEIASERGYQ